MTGWGSAPDSQQKEPQLFRQRTAPNASLGSGGWLNATGGNSRRSKHFPLRTILRISATPFRWSRPHPPETPRLQPEQHSTQTSHPPSPRRRPGNPPHRRHELFQRPARPAPRERAGLYDDMTTRVKRIKAYVQAEYGNASPEYAAVLAVDL